MIPEATDVAIVGAGPYGLSLAAQLRSRGSRYRIFGQPMKFWRDMPGGINLKSFGFATSIYVPERGYTLPDWCRARGLEDLEPISMQTFAAYGLWMQERFVPDLETETVRFVTAASSGNGYELTLSDGRRVHARRVVFATGLSHLERLPDLLRHLPADRVTHTSEISDYSRFSGRQVAVVGGGASAVEAGALVHEAGGSARILVRGAKCKFHTRTPRERPLLERLREPMTVLGSGRRPWVLQTFPLSVRLLPLERRVRFVKDYLGAASPWWIKDRVVGKVPIELESEIIDAEASSDGVRLTIAAKGSGTKQVTVDHVVAGTGYEADLDRLPFIDPELLRRMRRAEKAPALSLFYETSVPGLYFLGPMSAMSFGPLFRFVAGAENAAPRLARHLAGTSGMAYRWRQGWTSRGLAQDRPSLT